MSRMVSVPFHANSYQIVALTRAFAEMVDWSITCCTTEYQPVE
jgi:hypothetical protein